MSAVDPLAPVQATAAARSALFAALDDFTAAVGTDAATVDAAAQPLLAAIEAAPAGGLLREAARLRMVEAAAVAHLEVAAVAMEGLAAGPLSQSLAMIAVALAVPALDCKSPPVMPMLKPQPWSPAVA